MFKFLKSFIKPIWFITEQLITDEQGTDTNYTLKVIRYGLTKSLITTNSKLFLEEEKKIQELIYGLKYKF